jgi:hypothetical protein
VNKHFQLMRTAAQAKNQLVRQTPMKVRNGSKITIRQLRKQTFLNDWLWEVATGRNGRRAACHALIVDRCILGQTGQPECARHLRIYVFYGHTAEAATIISDSQFYCSD